MSTKIRVLFAAICLAFTASLQAGVNPDGSFSHSIPIEIPAGRQNIQPQLALTYNSNSPNGMIGVGWSLQGIPAITRMNYGNGIKYNNQDTFIGPEGRLIDISGGNMNKFHAENETWSKYTPQGICDGPCSWIVTDRNGIVYEYGNSSASKIRPVDASNSYIYGTAVRVWALSKVKDLHGNSYEIEYNYDEGQYYPEKIRYTLGATKTYVILFDYDKSSRTDKETSYAQSAYVKTNWRLERVRVSAQTDCWVFFTCSDQIRSYGFGYENGTNTPLSRLISFQEYNADNLALPATYISWASGYSLGPDASLGAHAYGIAGNSNNTSDRWQFLDFNGDGKLDFVYNRSSDGQWIIRLNNGTSWGADTPVGAHQHGIASNNELNDRWRFIDWNADGKPDFVYGADDGHWYLKLNNNGTSLSSTDYDLGAHASGIASSGGNYNDRWEFIDWNNDRLPDLVYNRSSDGVWVVKINNGTTLGPDTNIGAHTYNIASSGAYNDRWRFTDWDADGLPDLIYNRSSDNQWVLKLNQGGTLAPDILIGAHAYPLSTNGNSAGDRWQIADWNGDGRPDLVYNRASDGEWVVKLNKVSGFESDMLIGRHIFNIATDGNIQDRWRLLDWNRDGKLDLIYYGGIGRWYVKLNTGTAWDTEIDAGFHTNSIGMSSNGKGDRWQLADFNGDGKPDLVYADINGEWFRKLHEAGSISNLLTSVRSPTSAIVAVTYSTIPQLSSATCPILANCLPPQTTDPLTSSVGLNNPTPSAVVSTVISTGNMDLDGNGSSDTFTTEYAYFNSRMTTGTIPERTSLGFEKIKTRDVASGNYKIDTYRQDKPFHGRLAKTANYLNGILDPVSETIYPKQYEQYYCSENGCTINNPAAATPVSPQQIRPKLGLPNAGSATVTVNYQPGTSTIILTKEEEIREFDGNTPTFSAGNPSKIRQTVEGHNLSKTVFRHLQYINNTDIHDPSLPRTIGLVYNEKLCLTSNACTGTTADPNFISESNTYYDSQGFTGAIGTRKLVTKKESFLSTDNNGAGVWVPETYLYDNLGNITQKIDAQGIKTTIVYDNDYKQYPTSVTKLHLGNSTRTTYDYDFRFGKKILETTEDDGITTLSTLDASGFVSQVQTQNGATILSKKTFAHSAFGTTPIWTQECTFYGATFTNSSCRRKFTDALGRAYREEYPELVAGVEQQMAFERRYDSLGRETYVSQPKLASATFGTPNAPGEWSRKIYDTQNRLTDTISFDSKTTHIEYQNAAAGSSGVAPTDSVSCTITRAPDLTKKRSCDGIEGKPVRVEESYGTSQQTTVLYHYDSLNRLDSVASPQSTVTTLNYLGRSQLQQSIIDQVAGTTSYEYYLTPGQASFAKLKKETRPASTAGTVTTVLEYDASFGRLSKTTKADSVTNYTYDETSLSYGKGRLTTQEHTVDGYTIRDQYSYNDRGETTNTTRRIWNPADQSCPDANVNTMPCLQTFGAVKDELGRIKTMTYPDGKVTAIEYMPGSTKNVHRIKHDGTTYATYSDYTFDIMAHVQKITYGNGLVHDYKYHPLNSVDPQRPPGMLESIKMGKSNEDPYLNLEITYDVNLNIQRIDDHVIPAWTTEYHYDSLNRLKDAVLDVDGYVGTTYRYYKFDNQNAAESKGNLEIKADRQFTYPSGKTYPTSGQTWDSATQTASGPISTYTWSGNGNLLTKGPLTFTYDGNNMLKQAVEVDGSSATVGDTKFLYDQSGQRLLKKHTRGGVTIKTWYLGDGLEVREKYVGVTSGTPNGTYDSSQTTKYIYGIDDKKLASITGGVYTAALSITADSMLALADSYSSSSVSGLASKAFYTFYGIYAHENFAKTARITALVALLLMLGIWLVRSHRRSRENGGVVMPLWIRGTALTLVLPVFTLVNCNWLQIPSGVTQGQVNTMISELYTGLPAGTVYYSHNHLGSGNLVTDAAGNELFRITYDEYGQIDLEKSGKFNPTTGLIEHDVDAAKILITAVKYTGQEYDPETGLYYYNARYYDPQLGVFTTPDSEVPEFSDSQSYNRHMYVRGNPIMYTDPTGHFFWFVIAAIVVGAFVGGTKGQNPFTFDYKRNFDVAGAFKGGIVGAFSAVTGGLAGLAAGGVGMGAAIVGGVVGGAVGGFMNGHLNGQSWDKVLAQMGAGALGGFAGGFVGGALGEISSDLFGNTLAGSIGNGITKGAIGGLVGGTINAGFLCEWKCSVMSSALAGAGYGAALGAVYEADAYYDRQAAAQKAQAEEAQIKTPKDNQKRQGLVSNKKTNATIKQETKLPGTQSNKDLAAAMKAEGYGPGDQVQANPFLPRGASRVNDILMQQAGKAAHAGQIPGTRGNMECNDYDANMSMRPGNACS